MAFQAPPTTKLLLLVLVVLTHCLSIRCVVEATQTPTDGNSNVSLAEEAALGWTAFMTEDDEHGRILYGRKANRRRGYYISYAALAANHILCPAGSGRSYYTNNCYSDNRAVNPYSRGCSCITHCRRG